MEKIRFLFISIASSILTIAPLYLLTLRNHYELTNHFTEPDNATNYADYRYVGAHNAHVYPPFFFLMYQQDKPTTYQLSYGIRGFMWDTYDFEPGYLAKIDGPTNAHVCLSHGKPGLIGLIQKGNRNYQSLQYELTHVLEFMKKNSDAIITIILEDYADHTQTIAEIKSTIEQCHYNPLLTPLNWQSANNTTQQKWPTLGWMRKNNKRLIIFTQNSTTSDITWNQFSHCIENNYGTTNTNELCKERAESIPYRNGHRTLVIVNNFKWLPFTYPIISTKGPIRYETVREVATLCKKNLSQGRFFNGYFANRIIDSCDYLYQRRQKTVFEYINELNADKKN